MHLSSPWLPALAISLIRLGIGSRLAFDIARHAKRRGSPYSAESDFPLRGFAVAFHRTDCLAIEDAVGCSAQVLVGQAWITAEGAPRDIIADAGTIVPLELGVRFNVSAFRHTATVLIAPPCHLYDVGFSLQKRNGMRVLTVTSGSSRLPASLSGTPAAIAAFARRCFAATRTATI